MLPPVAWFSSPGLSVCVSPGLAVVIPVPSGLVVRPEPVVPVVGLIGTVGPSGITVGEGLSTVSAAFAVTAETKTTSIRAAVSTRRNLFISMHLKCLIIQYK